MFNFDKSMVGKKVRFINAKAHEDEPWFYPEVGTIGTVIWVDDEIFGEQDWKVRWPDGTTESCGIPNDCWYCGEESLELIEDTLIEDTRKYSNKIWEKIKSKMKQENIDWEHYGYDNDGNPIYLYKDTDVQKIAMLAYELGVEESK